jgi:FkbM family methyltransferase
MMSLPLRIWYMMSLLLLWLSILKEFKGITFKSWINLFLSPLFHIPYVTFSGGVGNATTLWDGLYYMRTLRVIVYIRGKTEDIYFLKPGREGEVDITIRSLLKPGDVFVDIGAGVGYYTLVAGMKGCRVVSVEPVPSTVAALWVNIRLNNLRSVELVPYCAWHEDSTIYIQIPHGRYYGLASAFYGRETMAVKIPVKCIRLDKILNKYSEIKLIKIDVEGAEYEVLKGLEKVLPKTKFIIVELTRKVPEILNFLSEKGFRIKKLHFTTYILAYRHNS